MSKTRSSRDSVIIPPVGSKVRMRFGTVDVEATVTEHRGPLGVGGRELVRVVFRFSEADDAIETEVPVDEVTVLESAA